MRRTVGGLLVVALAAGLAATTAAAGAAPGGKSGGRPGVARRTITLVDDSRPTPANGSYAGAPDRTLETVVSYPARKGKPVRGPLPLVVFATGFGGTATNYARLYDHWVRAGFVVAAPTFPLSSEDAPGGSSVADIGDQPGDLRFVLDEMLRRSRAKGSKLRGLVDPDRVGLAGKSLGAITVLQVGYFPAERDPRFKAVIALTGLVSGSIDQHFGGIDTPLLLEHGDADETVPYSGSQDAYAHASPPKLFVTLFGQTHGSAFGGGDAPAERVVNTTTTDFLDAYVKGERSALGRLQRDADVPGVASIQSQT